jgi:hypothetical protein
MFRRALLQLALADRDNFNYPMLLGRRTLKDRVVVDPGRTFLSKRKCPSKPARRATGAGGE